jgi:hypothetical protein
VKIGLDDPHHALIIGSPPMKLIATLARSLQADMQAELRNLERAVTAGTKSASRWTHVIWVSG